MERFKSPDGSLLSSCFNPLIVLVPKQLYAKDIEKFFFHYKFNETINPFVPNALFLYALKTLENQEAF